MTAATELGDLVAAMVICRRCPRLVAWREQVAVERVARHRDEVYWGRPVPGFGDPEARLLILGLAPAAQGGNRTGRVFTGDRSGDVLFAALHRAGLADRATSVSAEDGLRLRGAWIAAVNRCAPPDNKPTPDERERCLPYLVQELRLLSGVRTILCLGAYAWAGALRALAAGGSRTSPAPRFGHASEAKVGAYRLIGCYHPSQQNTFTGRLTPQMLDTVVAHAKEVAAEE